MLLNQPIFEKYMRSRQIGSMKPYYFRSWKWRKICELPPPKKSSGILRNPNIFEPPLIFCHEFPPVAPIHRAAHFHGFSDGKALYIPGTLWWHLFWLELRPCFGGFTFKNKGHLIRPKNLLLKYGWKKHWRPSAETSWLSCFFRAVSWI